ncbi:unnamed protein product [Ectocarpus sp. 12 AP-2014]
MYNAPTRWTPPPLPTAHAMLPASLTSPNLSKAIGGSTTRRGFRGTSSSCWHTTPKHDTKMCPLRATSYRRKSRSTTTTARTQIHRTLRIGVKNLPQRAPPLEALSLGNDGLASAISRSGWLATGFAFLELLLHHLQEAAIVLEPAPTVPSHRCEIGLRNVHKLVFFRGSTVTAAAATAAAGGRRRRALTLAGTGFRLLGAVAVASFGGLLLPLPLLRFLACPLLAFVLALR